jgi:O-antigen/teichoic acid export membrane protein
MADDATQGQVIRQRVARNTFSNYIATAIVLGAGFVITPLILHLLGPSQYGLWVLVTSITAYGTLLNFGIGAALIKHVAEFQGRKDIEAAQPFITTAFRMYVAFGAIVLALSLVLAAVFPLLFNVNANDRDIVRALVVISGISVALAMCMAAPVGILQGLQRFDLVNVMSTLNLLLTPLAGLIVLLAGGGVVGFAAVGIPISLAVQLLGHLFIRRAAPQYRIRWRGARIDLARKIIRYSWPLLVQDVAGRIKVKSDEIVIGAMLPVIFVTPYYLARRLSEIPLMFTVQFQKVLMPLASELHAVDDGLRLKAVFVSGTRLTLALYCVLGISMAVLAAPILTLWVGAVYAAQASIVVVLIITGFIELSKYPAADVLQAMTRHQPLAITTVITAIANLALSIFLIPRIGIIGAAIGTLVPALLECFLVLPLTLRVVGVPAKTLIQQAFLPAMLPVVPTVVVLVGLQQVVNLASWPLLIGASALGVAVYAGGYLLIGAEPMERQSYKLILANSIGKVASLLNPAR